MKTAVDLPDELYREIKIRAVNEGRRVKDLMEELLRLGLDASQRSDALVEPRIGRDPQTGLPIILGGRPASRGHELTPERIKEILLEQEEEWYRQTSGR